MIFELVLGEKFLLCYTWIKLKTQNLNVSYYWNRFKDIKKKNLQKNLEQGFFGTSSVGKIKFFGTPCKFFRYFLSLDNLKTSSKIVHKNAKVNFHIIQNLHLCYMY